MPVSLQEMHAVETSQYERHAAYRRGAQKALPIAEKQLGILKAVVAGLPPNAAPDLLDILRPLNGVSKELLKAMGASGLATISNRPVPMERVQKMVKSFEQHVGRLANLAGTPLGREPKAPGKTFSPGGGI